MLSLRAGSRARPTPVENSDGEFQTVERPHILGRQFTTARTIAAEHEITGRVREGRNHVEPLLPRLQPISFTDNLQHLNPTQSVGPHGQITSGLDNNRRIEFNASGLDFPREPRGHSLY